MIECQLNLAVSNHAHFRHLRCNVMSAYLDSRSKAVLSIFSVSLVCGLLPAFLCASDRPLNDLRPAIVSLEPGSDATPVPTIFKAANGATYPAVLLRYESRISYDIPSGTRSFSAILARSQEGCDSAIDSLNQMRVRFLLDDRAAYDTVLEATTPPEQIRVPVDSAKKLTITLDKMWGGGAVYLAGGDFSSTPAANAVRGHILAPGSGYINLGWDVRQVAFHTYHPGELVPLQLEFAGSAQSAALSVVIKARRQSNPILLTIPVNLQESGGVATGTASWQVPAILGPATIDARAAVNGKPVFQRHLQIAIARAVDIGRSSPTTTFGIHLSSAGIPYLADSVADLWGARWGRVFLRWEVVEFKQGQYDWSRIDEVVKLYRDQHMEILGVLGETAPKWAAPSGPQTVAAFNRFVQAAVDHFTNQIVYWDVYNEIDSKYHGGEVLDKNDPTIDIRVLRDEMDTIHAVQPEAKRVCCSTGTSYWLAYDKRLYDNGLLPLIDIVSLHPYESGPPEARDGALSYVEMIERLRALERSHGAEKPVWSSEANWLIGSGGEKGVLAPYVDDHSQSQYVVRVNLLSMALGVPYFLHSPFFTPFHRELFLDTLSSYANMTYNLGPAANATPLKLSDGLYGIMATSEGETICALWTTRRSATIRLSRMNGVHFQDMYGNSEDYTASNVPLTGDPIYVSGNGVPSITVAQIAPAPVAKALANTTTWDKSGTVKSDLTRGGVRITSTPTNYGLLLKSPFFPVSPNSCYVLSSDIRMHSGGIGIIVVDKATGKAIGPTVNVFSVDSDDEYQPELKFRTGSATQIQIEIGGGNPNNPQISDFEISNPQIAACE